LICVGLSGEYDIVVQRETDRLRCYSSIFMDSEHGGRKKIMKKEDGD